MQEPARVGDLMPVRGSARGAVLLQALKVSETKLTIVDSDAGSKSCGVPGCHRYAAGAGTPETAILNAAPFGIGAVSWLNTAHFSSLGS